MAVRSLSSITKHLPFHVRPSESERAAGLESSASARATREEVVARGARVGSSVAGFVGGAVAGIVLDAGLVTVGAMALRRTPPFENVGAHHGRVILGASIPVAATVGALALGINNTLGGGPLGGLGAGAVAGLVIGSGLVAVGALMHRAHEPFEGMSLGLANALIAGGSAGGVLLGAALGALVGLA